MYDYEFVNTERHNSDAFVQCLGETFDDSKCENVILTEALKRNIAKRTARWISR